MPRTRITARINGSNGVGREAGARRRMSRIGASYRHPSPRASHKPGSHSHSHRQSGHTKAIAVGCCSARPRQRAPTQAACPPLRCWLITPELQWQFRRKMAYLTGVWIAVARTWHLSSSRSQTFGRLSPAWQPPHGHTVTAGTPSPWGVREWRGTERKRQRQSRERQRQRGRASWYHGIISDIISEVISEV